ncbi:hypothetical protein CAOG_03978 [Capsaspora owczarzaki ATCC 30864]|nr:hypothetical protein CAOG_03978 [Capsaspora owczarzaki ATCC 30864]|eukprot:XP_004347803.2 hypothetical protein CAOG_03978 [Capsaspora owczarzaki ATCC 30864]
MPSQQSTRPAPSDASIYSWSNASSETKRAILNQRLEELQTILMKQLSSDPNAMLDPAVTNEFIAVQEERARLDQAAVEKSRQNTEGCLATLSVVVRMALEDVDLQQHPEIRQVLKVLYPRLQVPIKANKIDTQVKCLEFLQPIISMAKRVEPQVEKPAEPEVQVVETPIPAPPPPPPPMVTPPRRHALPATRAVVNFASSSNRPHNQYHVTTTPTRTPLGNSSRSNLMEQIGQASAKGLRRTTLHRSPGGTPQISRKKKPADGFEATLLKRFHSVNVPSPGGPAVQDENLFSPLASPAVLRM